MSIRRKLAAATIRTFWRTLGARGNAVIAAGAVDTDIGYAGVALAFGRWALNGASSFGDMYARCTGTLTFGLMTATGFSPCDILPYAIVQGLGGVVAGAVLFS